MIPSDSSSNQFQSHPDEFQPRATRIVLDVIRPLLLVDESNPKAVHRAAECGLKNSDDQQDVGSVAGAKDGAGATDPNLIVVVGGDGAMLHAIRNEWRRKLPFYGVNTGHYGFLLNKSSPNEYVGVEVVQQILPLLWVETESEHGVTSGSFAFNDAWVEVRINGQVRLPKLVADGVLVSTAAGSTSYARAMGASSLPLGTPALILVGSNVLRPIALRPSVLPIDAVVEFSTLDPAKRPLRAFIDGVDQGSIRRMKISVSRESHVALIFEPSLDPAEKLARIQFPSAGAEGDLR